MAGAVPVHLTPSQRLRGSGASRSAREEPGQQRLESNTARQLLRLPVLQRVVADHSKALLMISYLIWYSIPYSM
jgi:hypothetical protein